MSHAVRQCSASQTRGEFCRKMIGSEDNLSQIIFLLFQDDLGCCTRKDISSVTQATA